MMPNFDHFPDFAFRFFQITIAEDGPPGFTFVVPGLRIVARCLHPNHDLFIIDTDDAPAGIEELIRQLDGFRSEVSQG